LGVFAETDIPVMLFGGPCGSSFMEHHFPHRAAGMLAAQPLIEVGHRRILFLGGGGPQGRRAGKEDGVTEAVLAAGGTVESLPIPDNDSYDDYYHLAASFGRNWRQTPPAERVTAVVCRNDQMAMAALAALTDVGVRVPDDLSLVGMDNLP